MVDVKENSVIPLETLQKVNDALNFCGGVEIVEIKNNDQYLNANELFKQLNSYITKTETERKAVKEPYLQKGKEVDSWFKDPQAALANLKTKLDTAIRTYSRMLEEQRRKEQERLNREAEEKRRKQEEAAAAERAKAEELRRQAEEADEAERAKLLAQADKADAKADVKEQKAENIVAPVAQSFVGKVTGVSTRQNWKCEITDPMALVKWCCDNGYLTLLEPNQTALNAWAKSQRTEKTVPGARIFNDEKLTGRM
jgi:type IV secretory pathway VirB10-like protein